jgi:ATP-dependent DNA ligase
VNIRNLPVRGFNIIFDVIKAEGQDLRPLPFKDRLDYLNEFKRYVKALGGPVYQVRTSSLRTRNSTSKRSSEPGEKGLSLKI